MPVPSVSFAKSAQIRLREIIPRKERLARIPHNLHPLAAMMNHFPIFQTITLLACFFVGMRLPLHGAEIGENPQVLSGKTMKPEELASLPFGPANEQGLRAAWIFEPMKEAYHVGEVLKCRIIFHNSGEAATEFTTDVWHQDDTWMVTDAEGKEIKFRKTWFTGITPVQGYRLEGGQTCEISAHGVGIGIAEYAEKYSQALLGVEIHAQPEEEVHCQWKVQITNDGKTAESGLLTTGEVKFKVLPALPLGERPPGVAHSTGGFDLAPGIALNVSQIGSSAGYENLAWITWDKTTGATADGKADFPLPRNVDPKDYSVPTFIWPRGGSALWILQSDLLRKIDFATVGAAQEQSWKWAEVPEDFGGADAKVRVAIGEHRPSK